MTADRPTYRQLRLLAWLREPTGDFPRHEAIDWSAASWSAAEIVRHSGIYRVRTACLADVHALVRLGEMTKVGDGPTVRWRMGGAP